MGNQIIIITIILIMIINSRSHSTTMMRYLSYHRPRVCPSKTWESPSMIGCLALIVRRSGYPLGTESEREKKGDLRLS